VAMPVTPVNEDRDPMSRQDNVGPPGQRGRMQAKPESRGVKGPPDGQFRGGVLAPDRRHDA